MRLKYIFKKKYNYKGSKVVIIKTKDNLVTIENIETGLRLKVQKHLVTR